MSRADKVAALLASCSGPTAEPVDMSMDYGIAPYADAPPGPVPFFAADYMPPLPPGEAARLFTASVAEIEAARAWREEVALSYWRLDAINALSIEIALRLQVPADGVKAVLCAMPADDAYLLDDVIGWSILADTAAQLLGFTLDPNQPPFFNPTEH